MLKKKRQEKELKAMKEASEKAKKAGFKVVKVRVK